MVLPGPRSRASRIAPATLIAEEPPSSKPSCCGQIEQDRQGLLVGDLIGDINGRIDQIGGDAALADALGDRRARGFQLAGGIIGIKRRAHRIGQRDFDRRTCAPSAPARRPPVCRRCRPRRRNRRSCRRAGRRFPDRSSPHGRAGWRHCRTGWPRSRLRVPCRQFRRKAPGIFHVIIGIGIGNGGNFDQFRALAGAAGFSFLPTGCWE